MADRWPTRQYPRQKSLRGVASVRVTKSTVRVAFEEDPENIFEVPLDKAPELVKNGKWAVTMSAKHDRIFSISPVQGMFQMRFKEFAHAQGQIPAPQHYQTTYQDKDGATGVSDYDAFTALLEITEGPCAGMTVGHFVRYYFADVNGEVGFDKPKSKYTKQLGDFLDAAGAFDKGPMKFSENILPALQSRLQTANYQLAVILKDGRVDSLTRVGLDAFEGLEDEPEDDSKLPDKPKATRKAKAKIKEPETPTE